MRRCALAFILLLVAGTVRADVTPPRGGGGGGGAAPITLVVTSGAIASGASESGDTASWCDICTISEMLFTSTASASVSIEFFRRDTKLAADRCLYVSAADGMTSTWRNGISVGYLDSDATTELHWKITNHGAAATVVSFTVYGVGQ